MSTLNTVIDAARQRALAEFSTLMLHTTQQADKALLDSLETLHSAFEQRNAGFARGFLRMQGSSFLQKLNQQFSENLDRALRTMYVDLRSSLSNISSDSLSLIDDETVNSQLEVGRLVQRMHEADHGDLNRLNVLIAQLHQRQEISERENPFRPYLIARTLHQVLQGMQLDPNVHRMLSEELSNALIILMRHFYAAVHQVFLEHGVKPRLAVKPSGLSREERLSQARQAIAERNGAADNDQNLDRATAAARANGRTHHTTVFAGAAVSNLLSEPTALQAGATAQPHLQRLQSLLQQMTLAGAAANAGAGPSGAAPSELQLAPEQQIEAFQNFVWKIFNQNSAAQSQLQPSANPAPASESMLAPAPTDVIARLSQYQKLAARGEMVDEQLAPGANQLFALRDLIGLDQVPVLERVAIDVVAMLFDFMLDDAQIPAQLRNQIGRLQIPFLKAAMLAPDMLQQPEHPARLLLNRMSSAAVGVDPSNAVGQQFTVEFTRIVTVVLENFQDDVSIFSQAVAELEAFLTQHLQHADALVERSVEAIEQVEKSNALMSRANVQLQNILQSLTADQRVVNFIQQVWGRVLVQAALADAADDHHTEADSRFLRCRSVMPALIWSAYETEGPEQRSALIRLLPRLVKSLKTGLTLISLTEEESRQALNMLIEMHAERLRVTPAVLPGKRLTLDQLQKCFSDLTLDQAIEVAGTDDQQIDVRLMDATFAQQGIDASMEPERIQTTYADNNQHLLAQLSLGSCVERWSGTRYEMARVTWISKRHTIYMFKIEKNSRPIVYSTNSLAQAMKEKQVRLVEYAPVFERAMDAILLGVEAVKPVHATRH